MRQEGPPGVEKRRPAPRTYPDVERLCSQKAYTRVRRCVRGCFRWSGACLGAVSREHLAGRVAGRILGGGLDVVVPVGGGFRVAGGEGIAGYRAPLDDLAVHIEAEPRELRP